MFFRKSFGVFHRVRMFASNSEWIVAALFECVITVQLFHRTYNIFSGGS